MNTTIIDVAFWMAVHELEFLSCFIVLIIGVLMFYAVSSLISYPHAYCKSKLIGPLSSEPFVPFILPSARPKQDVIWKSILPGVRIYCNGFQGTTGIPKFAIRKLKNILKNIYDLNVNSKDSYSKMLVKKNPIPNDTRIISIKMNGFKHGDDCHEFKPTDGRKDGSYYTYRMYGDNRIQVTNYVKDGVSYVAGFCIYIRNPTDWGICYREETIHDILKSEKYIVGREDVGDGLHTRELTVEYCRVVKRSMLTAFKPEGAFHQEYNNVENVLTIEKCHRCTNRADRDRPPTYLSLTMESS